MRLEQSLLAAVERTSETTTDVTDDTDQSEAAVPSATAVSPRFRAVRITAEDLDEPAEERND